MDGSEREQNDRSLSHSGQRLLCILPDVQLSHASRFGEAAWRQWGSDFWFHYQCELCGGGDIYPIVYQNVCMDVRYRQDNIWSTPSGGRIRHIFVIFGALVVFQPFKALISAPYFTGTALIITALGEIYLGIKLKNT